MRRLVRSLAAVLVGAALAAPAHAADWDEGDVYFEEDFRGAYVNEPKDWAGMGDEYDPIDIEVGVRYWYSWGVQSFAVDSASYTSNDQSHILEGHLRIDDNSSNTYAKGVAGYSIVINGDYSGDNGTGTVTDGHIGYIGADIGWSAFGSNEDGVQAGVLVGYMYWNDSPNTTRANFTTATSSGDIGFDPDTGETFIPMDSAPNNIDVHALRLGLQGRAEFGDIVDLNVELAGVPYAKINGTLGAHEIPPTCCTPLGNLTSVMSSPTEIDGWGYGAMGELMVGVRPIENLTFRLGGRAWYLQGTYDATFSRATIGDPTDSNPPDPGPPPEENPPNYDTPPAFANQGFIVTANPFSMLRYGLLAELTYSF
jgi:hypothetical protein